MILFSSYRSPISALGKFISTAETAFGFYILIVYIVELVNNLYFLEQLLPLSTFLQDSLLIIDYISVSW
jgi:hypothetical protein